MCSCFGLACLFIFRFAFYLQHCFLLCCTVSLYVLLCPVLKQIKKESSKRDRNAVHDFNKQSIVIPWKKKKDNIPWTSGHTLKVRIWLFISIYLLNWQGLRLRLVISLCILYCTHTQWAYTVLKNDNVIQQITSYFLEPILIDSFPSVAGGFLCAPVSSTLQNRQLWLIRNYCLYCVCHRCKRLVICSGWFSAFGLR